MSEHIQTPIDCIQLIASKGQPVTAADHRLFAVDVDLGVSPLAPHSIIGTRYIRQHLLPSGALEILTIDAYNEQATEAIRRVHPSDTVLGSLAIQIPNRRWTRDPRLDSAQPGSVALWLDFATNRRPDLGFTTQGSLENPIKLDLLRRWGVEFIFIPDNTGKLTPRPHPQQTEIITATLQAIATEHA